MEKPKIKILGIACSHRKGRNTAWLVQYSLKVVEKFGRRIQDLAEIQTEFVDLEESNWVVDGSKCKACGNCVAICPVSALNIGKVAMMVDPDSCCRESCRICERQCPENAITAYSTDKIIQPCTDCELCYEPGQDPRRLAELCPIKNDYLATELVPKMAEADGYIFGAPVYAFGYTGKFRLLFDRLAAYQPLGYFSNKPAAVVTVALMGLGGGQESCAMAVNHCIRGMGMLTVSWAHGACGNSGPPLGPLPGDDDGKVIAVKGDRSAQYVGLVNARRVAEFAYMQKLAKEELGDLYLKEFTRV